MDSSLRTSCYAQNDESIIDCHESATADSRNDDKSPLPCGGDLGVGKSPQCAESRNDSTKEILAKYNKIFLSIRICDPAVGSGHFLVSALNELIALKSELGLLLDCDGVRLSDIDLVLENDELLIKDSSGKMLDYTIPAHERVESHKIQKALFYTKKELIENCLFGVDINPNSVEICKLRLWIELLKYSYYENIATKELQTLPNIDINIKCGNSLVSNIALNISKEKLEAQLKSLLDKDRKLGESNEEANEIKAILHDLKVKLPKQIESYKEATNAYKNETNKDLKTIHKNNIESAKDFIFSLFVKTNPQYREFKSIFAKYLKTYGYGGIDNIKVPKQNQQELEKWCNKLNTYLIDFNYHKTLDIPKQETGLIYDEFLALVKSMNAYELIKTQAKEYFEWRFEFPEVLDKNGEFMGFDLIVGNPPYIRQEEIKELKPHLQKSFNIYSGTSDIYTYFYEQGYNLLRQGGILTLITSNKFCRAGYGANLRAFLLQSAILDFVDLNGVKVFDKATVDTCIVNLSKQKPTKSHTLNYANPNAKDLSALAYSQIPQDSLSGEAFIFADSPTLALKQKIERFGTPLKEWDIEIYRGVLTGYNEAFIIDTATKDKILADCNDTIKSPLPCGGGLGVGNLTERERTAQIIKPILRGRDIKRYSYEWANLWLIGTFPALKLNIDDYPALKKYLESFMPRIAQSGEKGCRKKTSNKWFETQDAIAYYDDFEKEILVWKTIGRHIAFAITEKGFCIANSTYFISANVQILKYLQSILLSKIMKFYILQTADTTGAGDLMLTAQSLERLPIPKINAKNQKIADEIVNLVDKILQAKAKNSSANTTLLESQIDNLVYQLYELDSHEIQIIESK